MYCPVARFSKKKSFSSGQVSATKFTVAVAHPLVGATTGAVTGAGTGATGAGTGATGAGTGAATGADTGAATGVEPQKEGLEVESLHPSLLIQSAAAETRA